MMSECHQHAHRSPSAFNRAFAIAIGANGIFVICQIIFAFMSNSTSLFADAIHNLGDVFSLIVAWIGNVLLKRLPTERSTYGMKKASILAALGNVILIFTCGIIATEAIYKFISPTNVEAGFVMIVASIGILVNGLTAVLFFRSGDDINIRAAFLHLVYDALVSVGVVLSAALLYWTGWMWLDPLMGLIIALIILKGTWALCADSFRLILDGVPRNISFVKVREFLSQQPGVKGLHDLHIWALSTQENALSVHLWMPEEQMTDETRQLLKQKLREEYRIHHTTIQIEQLQSHCEDACVPFL
jgi:cobalt-zinc-cadmium efflux system protein